MDRMSPFLPHHNDALASFVADAQLSRYLFYRKPFPTELCHVLDFLVCYDWAASRFSYVFFHLVVPPVQLL